jgi:hypothetical protein
MRMGRWILLELAMMVAALIFASVAVALASQGSSYSWAQPGTAPVSTPFAQPPARILSPAAARVSAVALSSGYVWAQPGAVSASAPSAQLPVGVSTR